MPTELNAAEQDDGTGDEAQSPEQCDRPFQIISQTHNLTRKADSDPAHTICTWAVSSSQPLVYALPWSRHAEAVRKAEESWEREQVEGAQAAEGAKNYRPFRLR